MADAEDLVGEIESLEAKLADPKLFSSEAAAFNRIAAELEAKRESHSALEEQWLELEMLREEVEGG